MQVRIVKTFNTFTGRTDDMPAGEGPRETRTDYVEGTTHDVAETTADQWIAKRLAEAVD